MGEIIDQIQISLTEQETTDLHRLAEWKQMDKTELLLEIIQRGIRVLNVMKNCPDEFDIEMSESGNEAVH